MTELSYMPLMDKTSPDIPPRLTDRAALARNRHRAGCAPVTFLQDIVADEVQERLQDVNRPFTAPAIVTALPEIWAHRIVDAVIVPDDDTLALERGAYDFVHHALSLHWANDPVGQLVQCRLALRPDGLFIGTLIGGQSLNELRSALAAAEAQVTGGLSPRIAPMGEIRDWGALLQRAGFALPVADTTVLTVSYASAFDLMRDLRNMGEGNALQERLRHPTRRAVLHDAARIYAESFGMPDGRIPATFEIITLTGWAPAPDQPKPLRPGSATHRLEDALTQIRSGLTPSDN